jgi:hypothetical protein
VAQTGASLHYWQFRREGERLHLDFLSTFGGNRRPIGLLSTKVEGETLKFFAPERKMLTLGIGLEESQVDIRVYHFEKPHVHIRLKRASQATDEKSPSLTRTQGCQRLPIE